MIELFRTKKLNKMWILFSLLVACSFIAIGLHAQSETQAKPVSLSEKTRLKGSVQKFAMVSDVLDAFGGDSESNNYKISVDGGGQPSVIGISESDSYIMEAGYVHAAFVRRGDANTDGAIDVADVMYLINYLFIGGSGPCPMEAGDANCDGFIDVADVMYLTNYLFIGGSPPCNS
jgi:hypothetical protein